MSVRRIISAFLICTCILLTAACSNQESTQNEAQEQNPTASHDNENLTEADKEAIVIYEQSCIRCHAADLSGRVGEQSNLQHVGARLHKEQIIDTIKNGGQIMPPQKQLSDEEIETLANWLAAKK